MTLSALFFLMTAFATGLALATAPTGLGAWILLLASLVSTLLATSMSSWFGFILFLIYIGGLLVMFAYFTATTPNQPLSMLTMWVTTALAAGAMMLPSVLVLPTMTSNEPATQMSSLLPTTLLSAEGLPILSLLAMTLFFALVAVVKVSCLAMGALRPFAQRTLNSGAPKKAT